MRSRVRVSQRPPFLLLSGVIRLHDDAFLFRAISRSIREFCKARSSPRLSTEILFSCLRHAIRGPSPPKFSVFVKSRLHGFLNSRWRTALILAKQPKIQKQRVSPFSKFCRVKNGLDLKIPWRSRADFDKSWRWIPRNHGHMSAFFRDGDIRNGPKTESCNLPESAKRTLKNGESLFPAFMLRFWPQREAGKIFQRFLS